MKRLRLFCGIFLSLLFVIGCVRRDGRNSDCTWPKEHDTHAADARHLSADAEFAEDLAIRYADTRRYASPEEYVAARDRCMGSLFEQIAKEHNVPVEYVSGALGHNRARIDLAVNLPFVLLYCFAAVAASWLLWRTYPPSVHGWVPGAIMAIFLSLAIPAAGTLLGEAWSGTAESLRVGTGHLSDRTQRLWWIRHRAQLFVGGVAVFWLAVSATARRIASNEPSSAALTCRVTPKEIL